MSSEVATNRLIVSSKYTALYQRIINRFSDFQKLGHKLIEHAEVAQDFRHIERLERLGTILSHLPVQEYQHIGNYYLAWCVYRKGGNARPLFEGVIEKSQTYKIKSLISLGALEIGNNDYVTALSHYTEAVRWSDNPSLKVCALKGIAIIRSIEGDNKQALKGLEALESIARYTNARVYYDYLNSYAVELSEAGRITEAQNISNIVLASPFTIAYPEWRETGKEIALRGYKSRSVVSFTSKKLENVLSLPERVSDAPVYSGGARVLDYLDWKKKMVKEPNGNDKDKLPENMSGGDIVMEILKRISNDDTTDEERLKILDYTINIISKRKKD